MKLPSPAPSAGNSPAPPGQDVAIVGMACVFPGAKNLQSYWENILNKVNAVGDPPPDWESELFYDPQSEANDRVYSIRGGYLGKLAEFNPVEYGIMPSSVDGGEPDHFLALRAAHEALADAGYPKREIPRQRAEVIIGRGTYVNRGNTAAIQHGIVVDQVIRILQQLHPEHSSEELASVREKLKASLPPFHAETAPGLFPNLISGRISNRLDLMGPNLIVDAACASSLIAVDLGMRDLLSGRCDLAIVGGVHASTPPPIVMIFCQLKAISRRGEIRPFDSQADGTLLGEGVGMVVLKRRANAERDGDRIYAIVKGIGTASDGRALGLLAPRVEGEELALRRAYEAAAVSPGTVGLLEAHGTATPVGDVVEIDALRRVFGPRQGDLPRCALGSAKSMLGHLMPASGIAGLIKTALALYHKVLPPTINCDDPNPKLELEKSVFYINTEARPWIHGSEEPRRAGVNAFGFGGINAHAVLEEYATPPGMREPPSLCHRWESEVLVISGHSREELIQEAERILQWLSSPELSLEDISLKDLAYTLNVATPLKPCRLTLVASSLADLQNKIERAVKRLRDSRTKRIREVEGVYYFDKPLAGRGKIAFVFPGEGSQYTNMLADLCVHFPVVRKPFDLMDRASAVYTRGYLSSQVIFPPPLTEKQKSNQSGEGRLWDMDSGAEAVFTANQALNALLEQLEIRADAMVGHSTGEHSALLAAGVVRTANDGEFIEHVRGIYAVYEALQQKTTIPEGVLVAVGGARWELLESMVEQSGGQLHVAMDNCPHQVVLCGTQEAMAGAIQKLQQQLAICQPLNFARAYHTPWFEVFCEGLRSYFARVDIGASKVDLYSCVTADRFPPEPDSIRSLVATQWARRVRFRETVERMYSDGVRIFVEVGPRGNLTGFLDDTLKGREYIAIPANVMHRSGITQLNHLLAQLSAHGVPMSLERLYERRLPQKVDIGAAAMSSQKPKRSPRSMPLRMGLQPLRLPPDFALPRSKSAQPPSHQPPEISPPTPPQNLTASTGYFPDPSRGQPQVPASLASLPGRTAAGLPGRSAVMQEHLNTMEQFLKVQSQVMGDYLRNTGRLPRGGEVMAREAVSSGPEISPVAVGATVQAGNAPVLPGLSGVEAHPFLDAVTKLIPGEEAIATRSFDVWERDILFQDHTLGRRVSTFDATLLALPVLPLTISMEILAEGGALLQPGKVLVGMRKIRTYRWITLEEPGTAIQVSAQVKADSPCEVDVRIRELRGGKEASGPVLIEGTMVFADDYPSAQQAGTFALQHESPSTWAPELLYAGAMFHGPSFQVVKSVDRFGTDGGTATMETLPRMNLFRSQEKPLFQTEPVLLDGAGQVVGYWVKEKLGATRDIFPYSLKSLDLFAPPPEPGVRVECRVRPQMGETQMSSDIDLVFSDGRLFARLEGWENRCFHQPANFLQLRISPRESQLSSPWEIATLGLAPTEEVSCCRLGGFPQEFLEDYGSIWLKVLAHIVLGRKEREVWSNLNGAFKRRREWLLGRCVAKDAVRLLLKKTFGVSLCPADVEILSDEFGAPMAHGPWMRELGVTPVVSISHSGEVAVALAAMKPNQLVGIDIESVGQRKDGFESLAFTPQERDLVPRPNGDGQREWHLRLWCAKEAVTKAIGRGLADGPHAAEVTGVEEDTGLVKVEVGEALLKQLPALREKQFIARTGREGDYVFSTVLYPERGEGQE